MSPDLAVLRSSGTALVLDTSGPGLPRVLHWGADLPDDAVAALPLLAQGPVPHSALDAPWPLTVLPGPADGWLGTPGYAAHRAGGSAAPRWAARTQALGDGVLEVTLSEGATALSLRYRMDAHGVLAVTPSVTNTTGATTVLDLAALRVLLPLPSRAGEVLDLTGRWCRERAPQRSALSDGTHLRASRRGRTGHDATLLLAVGTPGFGFRSGEVWSVHVAWSGNHEHLVERLPEGAGMHAAVLGGGELLEAGEIRLAPGESYTAPEVVFVHSAEGLDGISTRLHRSQRSRAVHTKHAPAARAQHVGGGLLRPRPRPAARARRHRGRDRGGALRPRRRLVRRTPRRPPRAGRLVGLTGHVARRPAAHRQARQGPRHGVRALVRARDGQRRLRPRARSTPTGCSARAQATRGSGATSRCSTSPTPRPRPTSRSRSAPWSPSSASTSSSGTTTATSWRPCARMRPGRTARPCTPRPLAFYGLLDRLRAAHPDLEIESCASGGARVDLGVLARTDRIWTSDCNDALERAQIQRWTSLLVPPELMGTHIGPATAHTTHRTLDLSFRMLLALQGHAGLEWDIAQCTPAELRGPGRVVRPLPGGSGAAPQRRPGAGRRARRRRCS